MFMTCNDNIGVLQALAWLMGATTRLSIPFLGLYTCVFYNKIVTTSYNIL